MITPWGVQPFQRCFCCNPSLDEKIVIIAAGKLRAVSAPFLGVVYLLLHQEKGFDGFDQRFLFVCAHHMPLIELVEACRSGGRLDYDWIVNTTRKQLKLLKLKEICNRRLILQILTSQRHGNAKRQAPT
ncbi:MAG: hypothetical protein ABI076_11055 [Acidobacteriaceae bacterium]